MDEITLEDDLDLILGPKTELLTPQAPIREPQPFEDQRAFAWDEPSGPEEADEDAEDTDEDDEDDEDDDL